MSSFGSHHGSASTADQTAERISPAPAFALVGPTLRRLIQNLLHPFELFLADDRLVAIILCHVPPCETADVDGVPQNPAHLLFSKGISAHDPARTGLVLGNCKLPFLTKFPLNS